MGYKVLNNAFSTLAGSLSAIATSLTVSTGHGDRFPVIAGADYTYITLEDASGNIEIVKVIARSTASDVMTIVRNQDGTVARSWAAGDIVELRVIAALLDMAIAHVDDTSAAHAASSIGYTPAGSIAANNVQAAIDELATEAYAAITSLTSSTTTNLNAHLNDTSDAHDASAISYAGGTGISATDVEGAIDELANEKANLAGATFTGDIIVPDEAYNASSWDGNLEAPTKNAIRDKIESLVSVPTGMIADFARTTAPSGWLALPLVATNVSRTTYAALFAAIGTTWGAGDGSTTFGLPYCPENYATVQANANVGTTTTGEIKSHTHTSNMYGPQSGAMAFPGYDGSGQAAIAAVIDATGGPANLAAGVKVLKCIKL